MSDDRCKATVPSTGEYGWLHRTQCSKKVWKEHPEDGFCKIHHPAIKEKREKESYERYVKQAEWEAENSPSARLQKVEKQRDELVEALKDAMHALSEAEAILGREYGDTYGPFCEMMIALNTKARALLTKVTP